MTLSNALRRTADAIVWADEHEADVRAFVPGVVGSTPNAREHHFERVKRAKAQRSGAFLLTRHAGLALREVPQMAVVVVLTRCSPRLLDDDNLAGALKSYRDGVADSLGVNDRDARVSWLVDQAKSSEAGVRIEIYQWRQP